jgi:prepilin-type N-terminal cleavage/methylation domain-containing protein/prepilin-type processing-associated H-X9-DG protein
VKLNVHSIWSEISRGKIRHHAGFTLIELLVVIAIISILMTLVFQAVRSGLQQARTANCLNNLKEIGKITVMFASDNDGKMPVLDKIDRDLDEYSMSRNQHQGGSLSWTCPSRNTGLGYVTEPNPINYTGNRNALAWITNEPIKRLSSYQRPSNVLLLADGRENFAWGSWIFIDNAGPDFDYYGGTNPTTGYDVQSWFLGRGYNPTDTVYVAAANVDAEGGPSGIRYRHNGNKGAAAVFADGHALYIATNQLLKKYFITAW